jgi:hypothetical protein
MAAKARVARTGCSSGQALLVGALGFPKRVRAAVERELRGFQSARTCSQVGIPAVGTKMLEIIARGKTRMDCLRTPERNPFGDQSASQSFVLGALSVSRGSVERWKLNRPAP